MRGIQYLNILEAGDRKIRHDLVDDGDVQLITLSVLWEVVAVGVYEKERSLQTERIIKIVQSI